MPRRRAAALPSWAVAFPALGPRGSWPTTMMLCCSRPKPRLGGHARTIIAGRRGDQPVDTGFIVFNHANYPNLTEMFAALDVPVAKS
jgi:hypothetical protein